MNVPLSVNKLQVVANLIRGHKVEYALGLLQNLNKKAAVYWYKVVQSAVSNATTQKGLKIEDLKLASVYATPGPGGRNYMRYNFGSKGRIKPYKKYRANLFVEVSNGKQD